MTALVCGVIARSTNFGSRLNVVSSISTNTGFAPTYEIAQLVATNVNGVVITSSPGPTLSSSIARCSAEVPVLTAMQCSAPTNRANSFSNCATSGPRQNEQLSSVRA